MISFVDPRTSSFKKLYPSNVKSLPAENAKTLFEPFIDFTKNRINTFYSSDKVQHTPMGKPFDFEMRSCLFLGCS